MRTFQSVSTSQSVFAVLILCLIGVKCASSFSIGAKSAFSFSPKGKPQTPHSSHVKSFVELSATAFDSEVATKETGFGNEVTKETAIEALEKLRQRQKEELLQTENLLLLVESADREGNDLEPLAPATLFALGEDYGFCSRSEGAPSDLNPGGDLAKTVQYGGPPSNILSLGARQFVRNWKAILGEYADEANTTLTTKQVILQQKLEQLTLNTTEIWDLELSDGPIVAPLVLKVPYFLVCFLLDVVFEGRYVPSRFYLLETVARMPYFSYISMLHMYETLGFWRRSADVKRIHFAEELNEYRHLLIMESLGGDQTWWVRFVAHHAAIVYYFVLIILFAMSPTLSYRFSELLETHAVNTYSVLLSNNEELLKSLPPSKAAVEYYTFGASDPFYAEFQTAALASGGELRRPGEKMTSLYDVFSAICADEGDHVSTMAACLDPEASLQSPSLERRMLTGLALLSIASYAATTLDVTALLDTGDLAASVTDVGTVAELTGAATLLRSLLGEGFETDMAETGLMLGLGEQVRQFLALLLRFF